MWKNGFVISRTSDLRIFQGYLKLNGFDKEWKDSLTQPDNIKAKLWRPAMVAYLNLSNSAGYI